MIELTREELQKELENAVAELNKETNKNNDLEEKLEGIERRLKLKHSYEQELADLDEEFTGANNELDAAHQVLDGVLNEKTIEKDRLHINLVARIAQLVMRLK